MSIENDLGQQILIASKKAFSSSERQNHRSIWDELAEFILTNQSGIFVSDITGGERKTDRLHDSTAIQANHDLAASIHSTITNPATKWSSIKFKDDDLNNNPEAVEWLETVNNKIHEFINESNFESMAQKNYQALTALGTMVLFQEEDPTSEQEGFGGFRFNAWHLSEVAFVENEAGIVDTLYREFKWPFKKIMERFPEAITEEMKQEFSKDSDREFKITLEIKPRDPEKVRFNSAGLATAKERPFSSTYVLDKKNLVLEEGGYYELPFYATRWSTLPGEVYGRGNGHIALPDIRTLNKLREKGFEAINRAIAPPMIAEKRNVLGQLDLRPNRLSFVRNVDGFRELTSGARFDVAQFSQEDLRNSIKSIFFIDKLMLPPRTETGEQTAFEISERLAQMQKVLGPTLSRLNNEYLTPLVIRSFKLLLRGNALPPMPNVLAERGVDIDIRFINPLSRSQRLEEINNLAAWVGQTAQHAQITGDASVLDWIDGDFITNENADIRGIPEGAVRGKEIVDQLREARAKAQQQQRELEQGVQAADIASKTGLGGQNGGQ